MALTDSPISLDETNQAAAALATAVGASAQANGTQVEQQAEALAPGLATGTNAPGGYNYQRYVAPTVDPLADTMVTAAKQAEFKQALKDAQYVAKNNYDTANQNYSQRRYDYSKQQAIEAKARQAEEDRRYAASLAASSGGGGSGSNVSDVTTGNSQYIGNNDYRGRLAYAAAHGDANAKVALQYVGNDAKFNINPSDPKYKQVIGALTAAGATNAYKAPKAAPTLNWSQPSPFLLDLAKGKLK